MSISNVIKSFLPVAIKECNAYMQESLRSPSADLFPVLASRLSYEGSWSTDLDKYYTVFTSLGLTWALCSYKGLDERSWFPEWGARALTDAALFAVRDLLPAKKKKSFDISTTTIHSGYEVRNYKFDISTTTIHSGYEVRNYKQVFQTVSYYVAKTTVLIASAYFLAKLQTKRNPSLSFKPYFYYGAGVSLLSPVVKTLILTAIAKIQIHNYLHDRGDDFDKEKKKIGLLASKILIPLGMAYAIRSVIGESVQINWKWQILSTVGAQGASYFLSAKG